MRIHDPADPYPKFLFFKNFERVLSFSDGVFSIAITLMVLSLTVPVLAPGEAAMDLPDKLLSEWPTFMIYFISFVIIGNWWVTHHRIFQHIKRADLILLWLNLLFLLCITIVPFLTTIIITYQQVPFAVAVYAFSQAIAGILLIAIWLHATNKHRLVESDLSSVTIQYFTLRGILGSATFFISIGIAAFNVYMAQLSWLFIAVLFWWLTKEFYKRELPIIDQTE